MKKLAIKHVVKGQVVAAGGCGRNWDNVCGRRD